MLARLLDHIRGTQEVTLVASATEARVQSFHHEDASTVNGALHTAMSMAPSEFDRFVMVLPEGSEATTAVDVTFSMQEAKSLLAFAEDRAVNANEVALFFVAHAHPVLLSTAGVVHKPFHADLVLATVERSVLPKPVEMPAPAAHTAAAAEQAPTTTLEEEIAAADLLAFGMGDDEFMFADVPAAGRDAGTADAASVDSATAMRRFAHSVRADAAATDGFIHDVSGITPLRMDDSLSGGRMLELSGASSVRAHDTAAHRGPASRPGTAATHTSMSSAYRTPHLHVPSAPHAALQISLALSPELTSTIPATSARLASQDPSRYG